MVRPLSTILSKANITANIECVKKNPYLQDDIPWNATHWLAHLCKDGEVLDVFYSSAGDFKEKPPKIEHFILNILDMAVSIELYSSFETWSDHMGYDSSSVMAEKRYKQRLDQVNALRKFVGTAIFADFMEYIR